MSTASQKPGGNAASRQNRKKMRIFAILAGVTLLTWSRQLFGGEEGAAKSTAAAAAAGDKQAAAPEKAGAVAKAPRSAKSILNFEQAMERMTQWPAALHRRVIEGPIEDLSPINWMLDTAPRLTDDVGEVALEEAPPAQARPQQPAPPQEPAVSWEENHADGSTLGITLRSTVIFGSKRYAVLNGIRYAEGDEVAAGSGRYLLASVRSREVILSSGGRTWTLVIRDQSVPQIAPDKAD